MKAILHAFSGTLKGSINIDEIKPEIYLPVPERPRYYNYTEIEHEIPGSRIGFKKAVFVFVNRLDENTALYEMERIEG